ncbi:MAG: cytochrome c family protein [Hyphomonas sp.]|jgi:cytochrome c|uniref:c-type cytochrome n=1 Tax=Hyphomonas TaxID=85 RepID=UPI000C4A989A|nr:MULTISPECIES: cytochrome c family protein [Hyphomonas]MBB39140.1 cytochrome c family protein [Hyphomonas sp.]|tara:strand:- start:566 stop:1141 length:576 start_codon:yes stop_codon:yes gene_type:complete
MRLSLVSASLIVLAGMTAACGGSGDSSAPAAPAAETPAATPAPEAAAPAAETPAEPSAVPTAAPADADTSEGSPEFASLPAPYNTADYARGRRTFKLCQSCHTTAEGAGALVGPNLYGLFGREAGTSEGFQYSDALKEADFIWTPDKVDHWLENPQTFLKGNRMTFAGVRRPDDRTAVIAYLMTQTGYTGE